jgi:hypothetical protein
MWIFWRASWVSGQRYPVDDAGDRAAECKFGDWCAIGTLALMPSGANVRAAMIAHRADHAKLQLIEGHFVGQVARVKDRVVMAARVRAIDENLVVSEGPLVG